MDITEIPTHELCKDLADSVYDIALCLKAREEGVVFTKDVETMHRAGDNLLFVKRIVGELLRRGYMPEV
ncbi:MAG TPA: hypothetical protein VJK02_02950 [Anaerolineales bacterium]|nr:hypothetical protein [Anaerolineales bacterium]